MKLENKHKEFKEKIYKKNYQALNDLYHIIFDDEANGETLKIVKEEIKILKIGETDNLFLNQYQLSIQYLRICSLIEGIITEFDGDEEKIKQIVNYYLNGLDMKELNFLGLSWYYDIKFYRDSYTVYSAGKIEELNWNRWLKNSNLKDNMIKDNILQTIMKACKEHINRDGEVKLMSFSKCFGIDLYKFMYLDNDKKSYLNIVMETQTNILKIKDKRMSVSEYKCEESTEIPDFFFDFSKVRSRGNISNLNTWYRHFLNQEFISQKEIDALKNDFTFGNNEENEWIAYYFLREKRKEEGKTGISARINPIKDREVIANNILWDTIKFDNLVQKENLKSDIMYSFELSENEFLELIYGYYYKLYEKSNNDSCNAEDYLLKFEDKITKTQKEVLKLIEKIELESGIDNNLQIREIEDNIEEKRNLKNSLDEYSKFLKKNLAEEEKKWIQFSEKVKTILSMIDWSYELINKKLIQDLKLDNIYQRNLNTELKFNNSFINLFKEICKELCFSEAEKNEK